jgi:shikimate kinase
VKKHIALTGFMAAGKSTIGNKLAHDLGVRFYDVDERIARRHGPIPHIFQVAGERRFRDFEYEAVVEIIDEDTPGVIALGGGAVTHDPTLALVTERTHRVFIKLSPQQIVGRLRRSRGVRPLLGPAPSLLKVRELYAQRMMRYAGADLVVEADGLSSGQVVKRVIEWMRREQIVL